MIWFSSRDGLNKKLERWRYTLEARDFRLSRSKIVYIRCGFIGVEGSGGEIAMRGVVIPRVEEFRYLGSIIEERGDIDRDANHCVRSGW